MLLQRRPSCCALEPCSVASPSDFRVRCWRRIRRKRGFGPGAAKRNAHAVVRVRWQSSAADSRSPPARGEPAQGVGLVRGPPALPLFLVLAVSGGPNGSRAISDLLLRRNDVGQRGGDDAGAYFQEVGRAALRAEDAAMPAGFRGGEGLEEIGGGGTEVAVR